MKLWKPTFHKRKNINWKITVSTSFDKWIRLYVFQFRHFHGSKVNFDRELLKTFMVKECIRDEREIKSFIKYWWYDNDPFKIKGKNL